MAETEIKTRKESHEPVTFPSKAFPAQRAESGLAPFTVQRRTPQAEDVQIEVKTILKKLLAGHRPRLEDVALELRLSARQMLTTKGEGE